MKQVLLVAGIVASSYINAVAPVSALSDKEVALVTFGASKVSQVCQNPLFDVPSAAHGNYYEYPYSMGIAQNPIAETQEQATVSNGTASAEQTINFQESKPSSKHCAIQ
jgi:hypothetical protein